MKTLNDILESTDIELRTILITCDGNGAKIKELALNELIRRCKREGADYRQSQ